jgi:antitoxin YefM
MVIKQMTEFRKTMKQTLDQVNDNDETVIISRSNDRDVVLISLSTYNSIQETLYLRSSKKNKERIERAMKDVEENLNLVSHQLIL